MVQPQNKREMGSRYVDSVEQIIRDFFRRTCHSDLRGVHSDVADLQVPILAEKTRVLLFFGPGRNSRGH